MRHMQFVALVTDASSVLPAAIAGREAANVALFAAAAGRETAAPTRLTPGNTGAAGVRLDDPVSPSPHMTAINNDRREGGPRRRVTRGQGHAPIPRNGDLLAP